MCGLAGFLSRDFADADRRLVRMCEAIRHRGPDDAGYWLDPEAGLALGHRRLSIIDLSPAGHQPMISANGGLVLAFNGEIYNFGDLRRRLEEEGRAPAWRGHSDTEVLLAGFEAWGVRETVRQAIGMFAFALWDRAVRKLTLGRDRMGEKPLYYGWQGEGRERSFLFGSELSALSAHPACARRISRDSLVQFLRHGHVGEGRSIYEGLRKLPPATLAEISFDRPEAAPEPYWSLVDLALRPPRDVSAEDAADELEALLQDAVGRQMLADVPVGAFLSGGIDSALVAALMRARSGRTVRTFSMGFTEKRYDEAPEARAIAAHLGTEHHELYISDEDLREAVPRMARIYDEPFADNSQIPTWLLCRMAREQVTVALTGDGGDEFFGGYDRYRQGAALLRALRPAPAPLRRLAGGLAARVPAGLWDLLLNPVRRISEGKEPNGQWAQRMGDYIAARDVDALHRLLVSRWRRPVLGAPGGHEPESLLAERAPPAMPGRGLAERMMLLDQLTYLPDDLLAKVDRASMAVSLETRAPLLDHRVAEFSWSLPEPLKLGALGGKEPLRRVLYRHVPREMMERPKMGFEVPIGLWLRGPLRDWAAALLAPDRLRREAWLDPAAVEALWRQHLSGRFNHGLALWNVLMFQAWLDASVG